MQPKQAGLTAITMAVLTACAGAAPAPTAQPTDEVNSATSDTAATSSASAKPAPPDPIEAALAADRTSEDDAIRELVEPCHAKDAEACYMLGAHWQRKDRKHSLIYYRHACGLDSVGGCFGWGYLLTEGSSDIPTDYPLGHKLLARACDADHANACSMLGLQHFWGKGTPVDHPRSAPYFRKACKANELRVACFNLAIMLANDEIPGGVDEAAALFERGCKYLVPHSCHNSALLALRGARGWTRKDATRLFSLGCKQRDQASCERAKATNSGETIALVSGTRSAVPTVQEWDAVGEVTVTGSSTLHCETKMVREWLRISCRGKNSSGGTPTSLRVDKGGQTDTYQYASGGVTSLVTPFVAGVHLEALFSWTNSRHRLIVDWPHGTPKPLVKGVFSEQ